MEAIQNYSEILKYLGRYGAIVGCNMVGPNYRRTVLTNIMFILNISVVLSVFYTMIFLDSRSAWLSSNILGITLQVGNM